eukprot:symbB.v1.2.020934.t1/scaffold1787.1/size187711/8
MALTVGTRVVVQGGRRSEFGVNNRGIVLDIDRDAGCCRVALDENPSVPAKVAIRHLSPDLDTYVSTARYSQEKIDALAEAIEACAQATSSFCSSTVREAVAKSVVGRHDKEVSQLSEQLQRRMARLEQRMEAIDEALRSHDPPQEQLQRREKSREATRPPTENLAEEIKLMQQQVMKELRSQLDHRLGHLAGQVEDVARIQSQLQSDLQALASKMQRQPLDNGDYEAALRKLTNNMEDIRVACTDFTTKRNQSSKQPCSTSNGYHFAQVMARTIANYSSNLSCMSKSFSSRCQLLPEMWSSQRTLIATGSLSSCHWCSLAKQFFVDQKMTFVVAEFAGFKIADLLAAGASVKNLRTAGFTDTASVAALRKLRVEAWKMKLGGFSLSDLRNGGYSSAELRIAGFSSESIAALEKPGPQTRDMTP